MGTTYTRESNVNQIHKIFCESSGTLNKRDRYLEKSIEYSDRNIVKKYNKGKKKLTLISLRHDGF